jgi:hypothetical protein
MSNKTRTKRGSELVNNASLEPVCEATSKQHQSKAAHSRVAGDKADVPGPKKGSRASGIPVSRTAGVSKRKPPRFSAREELARRGGAVMASREPTVVINDTGSREEQEEDNDEDIRSRSKGRKDSKAFQYAQGESAQEEDEDFSPGTKRALKDMMAWTKAKQRQEVQCLAMVTIEAKV